KRQHKQLLSFVKAVYLSSHFIGIHKSDNVGWEDVQDELIEVLEDYLNSGAPVVSAQDPISQAYTLYIETTPNPEVLKFAANKNITAQTVEYKNEAQAERSPLVLKLFSLSYVQEVFIDQNYVSITKTRAQDWESVKNEVKQLILDFLSSGTPAVLPIENNGTQTQDPISLQIISIIDEYIKPAVAGDGGNILFESYDPESKVVSVLLQGACSGCPSSTFTLKNGIESMLQNMMPGKVNEVIATNA
ncbi:MAG: NifU N-terminal domain-containing protein, partial [Flavobacteriaceae bacterium]